MVKRPVFVLCAASLAFAAADRRALAQEQAVVEAAEALPMKERIVGFGVAALIVGGKMAASGVLGNMAYDWANAMTNGALKPRDSGPAPDAGPAKPSAEAAPKSNPYSDFGAHAHDCALGACASLPDLKTLNELGNKKLSDIALAPMPTPTPTQAIEPPAAPAECGDAMEAQAAFLRGTDFDTGTLAWPRNPKFAESCYYVAAKKNVPLAQYQLADILIKGDAGVAANPALGAQWMEEAALNGYIPAQTRIAAAYETGVEGLSADPAKALYWYARAGEAGEPHAQSKLGLFAETGWGGVSPNALTAFYWLNASLRQGVFDGAPAMAALLDRARTDARGGERGAMYLLGQSFELGVPGQVDPNPRLAFEAYRDSLDHGDSRAQEALNRLCAQWPDACD
jgi:TPR repeat protein